ncbi:response regulator [Methylomonas sp. SURF-2]|uniref:histidine kinase n=1 Tax=Methylomonas subterranea TaxID=2952225 RepID=A0ABT1TJ86_9GAMM|nr:response regulator [Methylomonas sp. SURF-2]MCQ8104809.1 response regulator [Methylomonas sp. SURF-2]
MTIDTPKTELLGTILLVDDDSINLTVFGQCLMSDYSVLAATSGPRALEIAHATPQPDLILLDIMMPGMDGYEVMNKLKESPQTRDIPVIFVTALTSDLDESRGFELGAVDYIYKPCNLATLSARVGTQIELKKARDRLRDQNSFLEADLQRRLRENQLIQLELLENEKLAAIGQLAAGIAHEINNPLGFIYSNFNTLQNYNREIFELLDAYECYVGETDNLPELLEKIQRLKVEKELDFLRRDMKELLLECRDGLTRVRDIIQNLRQFADGNDSEWQLTDINNALEVTLGIFAHGMNGALKIHKDFADIPPIQCLPARLNQVFLSLLVNASQAIETAGDIFVRTGHDQQQIWVEITDTGHGIAPEHLPHVFEPFFSTHPLGKSIGLGLSTSQSIVGAHHGKIEVSSTPNQGTTFTVRLPVRQETGNQAV